MRVLSHSRAQHACTNPADYWFCCNNPDAACPGCREEPYHSADPFWWHLYEHVAPPLYSNETSGDSDSGSSRWGRTQSKSVSVY